MKKRVLILSMAIFIALGFIACVNKDMMMTPPFGSDADVNYSLKLWKALEKAKLVGPDRIRAVPYEGTMPHGVILEQLSTMIKVGRHTGIVYVKANYMGEGITRAKVVNDPSSYLAAITVMYRREKGYDPDNQDWFWIKYKADGSLHANPMGARLAGRVARGMDKGCIACHLNADGGDYLFNNTESHLD